MTIPELQDIPGLIAPLGGAQPLSVAVMVTSADGRATVSGRVGALTGDADQRVLLGVRELAAAVLVGGQTVRNEGYAELLAADAQARRSARGLPPEPDLLVFTRSADGLPPAARALEAPVDESGHAQLAGCWREIRARHPQGLIVCEGGPTLLGRLVAEQLLDQLVLCISPQLVAGEGKRLIEPSAPLPGFPVGLTPLAVAGERDFVFIRYGIGE